jgi:hypothetical protein
VSSAEEILADLWRFTAVHPEWEEGDDWDPGVAWWAVLAPTGLVLIDPLVEDWGELDRLVGLAGGCAGIIRTVFFHERSIAEARRRYQTEVWARKPPPGVPAKAFDHATGGDEQPPGGLRPFDVLRDDEIAVWLPEQHALAFGDVMMRDGEGRLTMCPESWVARAGGRARLREALAPLEELEPHHVLVSHGPLVLGDGAEGFPRAVAAGS